MADNTQQNIQLTVQVLDNFISAKKNVDQWSQALKDAQATATATAQQIAQLSAEVANATQQYQAAQAAIQATVSSQDLFQAATAKVGETLATLSQAIDEVSQKPLDNIKPEDLDALQEKITSLAQQVAEYGTNVEQANGKDFLPNVISGAKETAQSVQDVASALTVLSGNNETFQKLEEGAGNLVTVIDGVSAATELLSAKKYKAIAANVAQLVSEANLRAAKILGINTTAAEAAAEQAATVIKGQGSLASKAAAAAQWLWNEALLANPVIAIVAAVALLVVGIVALVNALDSSADAQKKADDAQKAYEAQAKQTADTMKVIDQQYEVDSKNMENRHQSELLSLKKKHASATEIAQAEAKQAHESADLAIQTSRKKQKAGEDELKSVWAAIAARKKSLEAQTKGSEEYNKEYAAMNELIRKRNELVTSINSEKAARDKANNDTAQKDFEAQQVAEDEQKKNQDKALSDQIKRDQIRILRTKEGTKQRLAAEKQLIRDQAKQDIFNANGDANSIKLIKEKAAADILAKEKASQKKGYDDKLKLAAENEKNISNLSKDRLSDESVYKKRLTNFKAQTDKEKELYDQLQKANLISKKAAEDGKKAADEKYTQYYNKLSQDRLNIFSKDLTDKLAMEKLMQQEKLTVVELTLEEQHKLEIENAESEKNLKLQILEEEKRLFPKRAAEIEAQIALIKQQYRTSEAKLNAESNNAIADKNISDMKSMYNTLLGDNKIYTQKQLSYKLALLEFQRTEELKNNVKIAKSKEELDALNAATNTKFDKLVLDAKIERFNNYIDQVNSIATAASGLMKALGDSEVQKAETDNTAKKDALQSQLDSGLITKKKYDKEVAKSETELAAKKKKIAREQAIFNRSISIANTIISTSEAIMGFLKDPSGLLGAAMSIAAGVTGAAQIATILATPIPTAAKGMLVRKLSSGGLLHGPSHAGGGIPIEAEGGEAIINKRSTAMYSPILSAINEAGGGVKFAAGGLVGKYASGGTVNYAFANDGGYSARAQEKTLTADDIHKAMLSAVSQVKVYTTVEDYRKADKNYTNIESSGSV